MKSKIKNQLKSIVLFIIVAVSFNSCIYYEEPYPSTGSDGLDGRAYVSLNWYDLEPAYIETDGLVPNNFYWDTFYKSSPGYYTVHYEYDYDNGRRIYTEAFEADVKVWVNRGEYGGVGYNGNNGADSYFEMALYPDGGFDFNLTSRTKSNIDSTLIPPKMGIIDSVTTIKNGLTMTIVYKRVEPRSKRIK